MSAQPAPAPRLEEVLARGDVWRGDALSAAALSVPSGFAGLDAELPGGGWPAGGLTELLCATPGIGECSLLLPALARLSSADGWLALVSPPWVFNAPAWAGVALERLVVIQAGAQSAWCGEQLLRCGGFAGVLLWSPRPLDAASLRRLQVAAEGQATLAWVWRATSCAGQPSPAPLRLQLASSGRGVQVSLLKRRGRPASRPLQIAVPRPASRLLQETARALAGAPISQPAARSPALSAVA